MINIEQKLIEDAKYFAKRPPEYIHSSIIESIDGLKVEHKYLKSTYPFNWLATTGLIASVFVLMLINMTSVNVINTIEPTINNKQSSLSHINLSQLSKQFEIKLTNEILKEKEALQTDFNYMKNKFSFRDNISI